MSLACARLGCTERAHTVLVFEPGSAAAWLMHAVEAHRTQGILLCRVHADVISVPVGWNLVDERDPTWEPLPGAAAIPDPDPEPSAQAMAVPTTAQADVVELATVPTDDGAATADEPAAEVAAEVDPDVAFEEVINAQWTDPDESEDEVGTPTLFAVDDAPDDARKPDEEAVAEAGENDTAPSITDTPLLNRAFRAAQRF